MNNLQNDVNILIYTREPQNEYTESLGNSIHFAYCEGEEGFRPLNQNYGVLFALSTIDEKNVIQEKGLKNPYLFRTADGAFGIIAVRVDLIGNDDAESKGQILLWTSDDLITFHDHGLVKLHEDLFVKEAACEFNAVDEVYEIYWEDNKGNFYVNRLNKSMSIDNISMAEAINKYEFQHPFVNLPNIRPGNILSIDSNRGKKIKANWTPIYNTEIRVPDSVNATSYETLEQVKAEAIYSDGSTSYKQVKWDYTGINFSTPGTYIVKGKVVQETYSFPLACGYADPVILPWNNKYYYIATNDNVDDIGMYVREADTISDLFAPGFKEAVILDLDEEKDFVQTFWAPEFHVIGDDLFILFAVGGKVWAPQCHMMKLKKGGDIMEAKDWNTPVRVKKSDGTFLTQDGITLDMTYFKADGTSCVVWSYRKGIGTPLDTGSMLYIATVDEKNPTMLTSEPVLLSRPLFGWENIQGTINNEGPYPLVTDDMVYITYSGGAAGGYTYSLGLLKIPRGSDFLNVSEWVKSSTPVLSYHSINGVYGPGHNSFFKDYNGDTMIMYHGEEEIVGAGERCSAMHRVHFNKNGVPVFNMSSERDLDPKLCDITIEVVVQ
ncbi:family 43 glycosylhydrolase [Clostridium chromiireducens]|uniref:Family 43 glycosylhydrolase n=1 Tax=Clostridium chromiireducens TaxID=225345 RepID=A0A964RN44_9CLOT|nr:family 43 glycosylhydrolase [Clostridium chromiireducens]MVX64692.1 family 43 glycosylhydrolase [Clostridium chromiireducens]